MNELARQQIQLPDKLEDLTKFALIGREKLEAVRAEIRAIEKVGLAKEVHEQKLQEAQEIAEAVLDAEVKIGELTRDMQTMQGQRNDLQLRCTDAPKSKEKQLKEIGISKDQGKRYETLASHSKLVEQAKADARAEGRIVTRSDVLNRIAPPKSAKQTMKEFKQEARERHEGFQQTSKEGLVNFNDIKSDRKQQNACHPACE